MTGQIPPLGEADIELERLRQRVAALERQMSELRALGQDFWREEAAIALVGATIHNWRYEVSQANTYFQDAFPCEAPGTDSARRWIGNSGKLESTIAINRAQPLRLSIHIIAFAADGLRDSFTARIDGNQLPWVAVEAGMWSVVAPARTGSATLHFEFSINRELVPSGKDVSFAFRSIDIAPA